MKILFITGRMLAPFFRGGDGITIDQLLSGLSKNGFDCIACGKLYPKLPLYSFEQVLSRLQTLKIPFSIEQEYLAYQTNYKNILLSKNKDFQKKCFELIENYKPDIVLTQMEDSEKVIEASVKMDTPVALYVHDSTEENKTSLSQPGLNFVFYNSNFTSNKFRKFFKIPNKVVYPIFDSEFYQCPQTDGLNITMVNPIPSKGGIILERICKELKEFSFQVILGWSGKMSNINLPNVKIINFGTEMKLAYKTTSFVIVPSQEDEAFCRIPVEAGFSNIPSISSETGGLPESVQNGGILINDYSNYKAWIDAIYRLSGNQILIKSLGQNAFENSQKFRIENKIPEIINIFNQIL